MNRFTVFLLALTSGVLSAYAKRTKVPTLTYTNVPYDQYERTKVDFWQAEGKGPRPLMVFIHGGGWSQGSKDKTSGKNIEKCLANGISVASVGYRLTGEAILPAPVHDAARAVQFLRSKAKEWKINKNKIVLTGGSAGGCTSVWLACHDDLANPNAKDPIERESTRVQGISVRGAQTAIDPKLIEPWIGKNVFHSMIYLSVGEQSIEDALKNYSKHEPLYKEFSGYYHLTQDDPPIYLSYGGDMSTPAKNIGHGIHHGLFGVELKKKSQEVGHNKVYLNLGGKDENGKRVSLKDPVLELLLN
jgi:hypothetical protein